MKEILINEWFRSNKWRQEKEEEETKTKYNRKEQDSPF